ncbi:MAG: TlpA disulfide reductase family protein [Xanthomonadales bacterium]|nr:TlpA disulfide reductase family protein [Xanthomonadales bacterium]
MKPTVLIMLVVAVAASAGGYFLAMRLSPAPQASSTPVAAPRQEDLVGQPRPDFSLSNLQGRLISAGEFDGKVLLLNFWASWCAPCVEEMPMLSELQRNYAGRGLQVLGIAVDDEGKARDFARELGVVYPVLAGQGQGMVLGRRYGNSSGMLPYSVLVDRSGIVRWVYLGALGREELERRIGILLQG